MRSAFWLASLRDEQISTSANEQCDALHPAGLLTDFSDTDSFPFTSFRRDHGREAKGNEAALRERYRELIAENIAYDALLTD